MNENNIYFNTINNNIGRNSRPLQKYPSFINVINTPLINISN